MNITELKTAVKELLQNELAEFAEWFNEFQEALWDRQIEQDMKAGKFDALIRQGEQAFSERKCKEI
jgi:DNA-binding transcriptional LysR family regulator